MSFGGDSQGKRQAFNNWAMACMRVFNQILNQPNVTWEQKLKAIDAISKTFPDNKRIALYFMNTEDKRV